MGCTKARPIIAHRSCREVPMDRENRRRLPRLRHPVVESHTVAILSWTAAPSIPSWRTAPLPSPRREPHHRWLAAPMPSVTPSPTRRPGRCWLQRFHLDHVLHALYQREAWARLAADTAAVPGAFSISNAPAAVCRACLQNAICARASKLYKLWLYPKQQNHANCIDCHCVVNCHGIE
jgi:hypothetical protein